jgi:hypothetical protein
MLSLIFPLSSGRDLAKAESAGYDGPLRRRQGAPPQ